MASRYVLDIDSRAWGFLVADDEQRIEWCFLNCDPELLPTVRTLMDGITDAASKFGGVFRCVRIDLDKLFAKLAFDFDTDDSLTAFAARAEQFAAHVENHYGYRRTHNALAIKAGTERAVEGKS